MVVVDDQYSTVKQRKLQLVRVTVGFRNSDNSIKHVYKYITISLDAVTNTLVLNGSQKVNKNGEVS